MKSICFLVGMLCAVQGMAQSDSLQLEEPRFNNTLLPFAFYLPETSLGFGGLGLLTFRRKEESLETRPCQLIYSIAYTLKNQLLVYMPFQYYMNEEKQRFEGELGYYLYFYNFYGLGPSSSLDNQETYSVNFPRFQLRYLQSVRGNHFLGLGFKYDFFDIQEFDQEGSLGASGITGVEGGNGFRSAFNYLFDNRNHGAFPTSGYYFDVSLEKGIKDFMSEYSFQRLDIDVRSYHKLKDDLVLANHLIFAQSSEGTPFYYMPRIATQKFARGIANRRFIDDQLTNFQTELRYPIYNRIKGVGFVSLSNIGETYNKDALKLSGGAGVRYVLDEQEKTRIRIDVGTSKEGLNFYFTLSEAF